MTLDSDTRELKHTVARYIDRLNAGDTTALMTMYTDDAVLMQPQEMTAKGRDAIAASYKGAFAACTMALKSVVDDILVDANLAAVCAHSTGKLTLTADGGVVPARTRELFVFQRSGGDWKIARYMFEHLAADAA